MLRENNWVTEYDVKSEKKGRPMKVYSLSASLDEIIKHYEDEKGPRVSLDHGGHPEIEGIGRQLSKDMR